MLQKTTLALIFSVLTSAIALGAPLNIVFITADDMNWDSLGCTGSKVPNITPHIDRLAAEGILFREAHATVPVCQPVRATMTTGRYPNRSGARGFGPIRQNVQTLNEVLHDNDYLISMLAKVPHYQPLEKWKVDYLVTAQQLDVGRCPKKFGEHTKKFLQMAKEQGKPFFHHVNAQDPHRPFSWNGEKNNEGTFPGASRIIRPDEVEVPAFLEDLPEVRQEVADYYTCVHRLDQVVGAVLRELDAAGLAENTLVMFFGGDHGMAFPFAKSNLYAAGSRGALILRWPGKIPAGQSDTEHLISTIDIAPTLLDAAGLPEMVGIDGRSFLPVAKGGKQDGRDKVFTVYHENFSKLPIEMRCVRTKNAAYIWNAWSDGKMQYRAENMSGASWAAMLAAAENDPAMRERCNYYLFRSPEEFFLMENDEVERDNRIGDSEMAGRIKEMKHILRDWMKQYEDPLLDEFEKQAGL